MYKTGYHLKTIDDIESATHWLARESDTDIITEFQIYRLYLDKYNGEYFILDDQKNMMLGYMWIEGDFVVLEKISIF